MNDNPVVLVAEDDSSIRLTLDFLLSDEGFAVHLASDGEEALALAEQIYPDVILLDGVMPKLNGREVLDRLRADDGLRHIPVIVLTGLERRDETDWPGTLFITKPFDPDELIAGIRELSSRSRP